MIQLLIMKNLIFIMQCREQNILQFCLKNNQLVIQVQNQILQKFQVLRQTRLQTKNLKETQQFNLSKEIANKQDREIHLANSQEKFNMPSKEMDQKKYSQQIKQQDNDSMNFDDNYVQEDYLKYQSPSNQQTDSVSKQDCQKIEKLSIMSDFNQIRQKFQSNNQGSSQFDQNNDNNGFDNILAQYYAKLKQVQFNNDTQSNQIAIIKKQFRQDQGHQKVTKMNANSNVNMKKSKVVMNTTTQGSQGVHGMQGLQGQKNISPINKVNGNKSKIPSKHSIFQKEYHEKTNANTRSQSDQNNTIPYPSQGIPSPIISPSYSSSLSPLMLQKQQALNRLPGSTISSKSTILNHERNPSCGQNSKKKSYQTTNYINNQNMITAMNQQQKNQRNHNNERNYYSVEQKKKILQPSKNNTNLHHLNPLASNNVNTINNHQNEQNGQNNINNLTNNGMGMMGMGSIKDYFGEDNSFVNRKVHAKNFIDSPDQVSSKQNNKLATSGKLTPIYPETPNLLNGMGSNSTKNKSQNCLKQSNQISMKTSYQNQKVDGRQKQEKINKRDKLLNQRGQKLQKSQKPKIILYKKIIDLTQNTEDIIEAFKNQQMRSDYEMSQTQSIIEEGLFAKAIVHQRATKTVQNVQSPPSPLLHYNYLQPSMMGNYQSKQSSMNNMNNTSNNNNNSKQYIQSPMPNVSTGQSPYSNNNGGAYNSIFQKRQSYLR